MPKSKADQNGPFKAFDPWDDWLKKGMKEFCHRLDEEKFDTSRFRSHMRKAKREQLLAVRSLIDTAIDCLNKQEKE